MKVAALVLAATTTLSHAGCDCGAPMQIEPLKQRNTAHPGNGNNLCWLTAATMVKSWVTQSTQTLEATAGSAFKDLLDAGRVR